MRNLIIITSVVFVAIIVTSYFYFSQLEQNQFNKQEPEERVASAPVERGNSNSLLWTFELTAKMTSKPTVCRYDDTSRFILVQDAYHILYAISIDGKQLWNAQLPGPLMGDIQQLPDRSLVFTTPERLYRIDTKGDPLPGFSILLPQKATEGPVISVEEEKTQINVPTRNRIFTYDERGMRLQNQPRDQAVEPAAETQPTDSLYYLGTLIDDNHRYLINSNSDRTLYCYRD